MNTRLELRTTSADALVGSSVLLEAVVLCRIVNL